MRSVLSVEQMRAADRTAIEEYNVKGELLMENAARSSAEYIEKILNDLELENPVIDIICGSGNNGGDGFALARHLVGDFFVRVFWFGKTDKMSPETKNNFIAAGELGVPLIKINAAKDLDEIEFSPDCVIDSMIGVGGSENIRGLASGILQKLEESDAMKIAIDAPTGLNTDTGAVDDFCFEADFTITMFAVKKGMLLNGGLEVCGEILVANLGVPADLADDKADTFQIEKGDLEEFLPPRHPVSSKFDYGRVIVVAGSKFFPGASALCSNAAILSGAGLVQLFSTVIHPSVLPEVIPQIVSETESGSISKSAYDKLSENFEKADVYAIGPGLSDNEETIEMVEKLIDSAPEDVSLVIDADGLRAINKDSKLRRNVILTPHTGELSRITGIPREEIEMNAPEIAKEWAKKLDCVIVLKYVPVIITDGEISHLCLEGNPGMASGGSGDVLTGLIAGLVAQGINGLDASVLGVYLHAKAGALYKETFSEETLTASSLLEYLPEAFAGV